MTATTPSLVREQLTPGPIPLFDLPDWHPHRVVAGITGRGADPGRGFDLGLWSDAPVGEVMSRWRAFRRALPEFDAVILGNQVHGVVIETVGSGRGWIQIDGIDGCGELRHTLKPWLK